MRCDLSSALAFPGTKALCTGDVRSSAGTPLPSDPFGSKEVYRCTIDYNYTYTMQQTVQYLEDLMTNDP